ncbi:MAG: hypothetical protein QGG90_10350, partial [Nitrospinota bacterium]|nr:hypothetical protein [Nitrospinota bacterium]
VDDPLGAVESEASLPAPASPEETRGESPPASEAGQEATIERLEGLLERIRAKSKGDEDS